MGKLRHRDGDLLQATELVRGRAKLQAMPSLLGQMILDV